MGAPTEAGATASAPFVASSAPALLTAPAVLVLPALISLDSAFSSKNDQSCSAFGSRVPGAMIESRILNFGLPAVEYSSGRVWPFMKLAGLGT